MRTEQRSTFKDLLGGRAGFLPIVRIGVGLSVFQELVGVNVICSYGRVGRKPLALIGSVGMTAALALAGWAILTRDRLRGGHLAAGNRRHRRARRRARLRPVLRAVVGRRRPGDPR